MKPGAWGRAGAATRPPAAAPSLRDVLSEELAAQLARPASAADDADDVALARRLQAEENASASTPPPPSTEELGDLDLALALAMQEEELRGESGSRLGAPGAHGAAAIHNADRHTGIRVVTREQLDERDAVWASRASLRGRTLYSDASLPAPPESAAAASGSGSKAREVAAALREQSEESLYQALKGGGRRAGYLTVGADGSGSGGGGGVSATGLAGNLAGLGSDGYVTKHDAFLAGRRHARALERSLGSAAGDLSRLTISQAAVSDLQRFTARQSVKGHAAHGRVEAAAHATSEGVLDGRTRMLLFKLLGSGRCDAISGRVSTGKEAAILLACGWHADVHAQLLAHAAGGGERSSAQRADGWASAKGRTWDGEDAGGGGSDEEEGGGIDEEGEEEEQAGEAAAAGAPSSCDSSHGVPADALLLARLDTDTPLERQEPATTRLMGDAGGATGDGGDGGDGGAGGGDGGGSDAPAAAPRQAAHSPPHGENADGSVDVALKVFKLTLTEFRNRKLYMVGDQRFAKLNLERLNPRKIVVAWATKEWANLVRIHRAGIPSPAPLLLDGHVVAMSFVGQAGRPSPQLRHVQLSRSGWAGAYRQVVAIMLALHQWCRLVHADLSEYNLLLHGQRVVVLDVGQAVDVTSHPAARDFLESDARNVTTFFARAGVHVLPAAQLVALVTGLAPRVAGGGREALDAFFSGTHGPVAEAVDAQLARA